MKKICLIIAFIASSGFSQAVYAATGLEYIEVNGVGKFTVPAEISCVNAVGTAEMKNMESQYDFTGTTQEGTHYARMIVYKDDRDLGMVASLVDMVDFKPELVNLMSNMGKNLIAKKMEENGAKLVEWRPAGKYTVKKHNGINLGARFILTEKLPITMSATVVVYAENNRLTGLALICPDSERTYWQPRFDQLIKSISN